MNLRKQTTVIGALMITTFLAGSASAIGAPFTEIDANGDNQLTKEELTATFGADRAATAMKNLDKDKNGTVSWEAAANAEPPAEEEVTNADEEIELDDVDLDGDNQVTWKELTDQFGEDEAAEILAILDDDADGTITEDEFVEAILAAVSDEDSDEDDAIDLDEADANGDGDLTRKELVAKFGEEDAKEILADLDPNKDGTVTDAEFEKIAMAEMDDEDGDDELDLYAVDLDGDGKITKEELKAFIGDDADAALQHLDEDMDGVISMAELDTVYTEDDPDKDGKSDDAPKGSDANNDLGLSDEELALAVSQAIVDTLTEELERLSEKPVSDKGQEKEQEDDDMDLDEDESWEDDEGDIDDLF